MTDQSAENLQIVKAFNDAFMEGRIDDAKAMLAEDVTMAEPESLPYGGTYRGPDGFLELGGKVLDTWDFPGPLEMSFHAIDNGQVLSRTEFDGISKATGKRFAGPYLEFYSFEDGKIKRIEVFVDTAAIAAMVAE